MTCLVRGYPQVRVAALALLRDGRQRGPVSESWNAFVDLVLPDECRACGRPGAALCGTCRAALEEAPRPVRSGAEAPGLPAVHAAASYSGVVRQLLLAHKERGAMQLARPLGRALASAVRSVLGDEAAEAGQAHGGGSGPGGGAVESDSVGGDAQEGGGTWCGPVRRGRHAAGGRCRRTAAPVQRGGVSGELLLVPVPSASRAVASRGHDPVCRMALAASRALRGGGFRARVVPVLRHRRPVADQSELSGAGRRRNVAGAFGVRRAAPLRCGGVVLVDDVVTTGSSLAEAARVVADAGGDVLAAAVVAATA